MQARGAVAAAEAAIHCVRVVIWHDALVGTRHVAARWVHDRRESLERDVALPGVGGLLRVAIATRDLAANRYPPGALVANAAGGVGVAEVEYGNRPVAQRRAEAVPVSG